MENLKNELNRWQLDFLLLFSHIMCKGKKLVTWKVNQDLESWRRIKQFIKEFNNLPNLFSV